MICSYTFLKVKYDWIQIISSLFCAIFAGLFAGMDFEGNNYIGNAIVLLAAVMMAFSCTLTEVACGNRTTMDYSSKMALAALAGAVTCMLSFELEALKTAPWQSMLLFASYGVLMFLGEICGYSLIQDISAVFSMIPDVLAPLITFPVDFLFFHNVFQWW